MSEKIGWIGLGLLGSPMAANLQESGYELTVYNRTARKAEPLAALGAKTASNALDVVPEGGIAVSVLWDSDATEKLVTPHFLARIQGGVHVGMCTGSPDAAKRLAKLHQVHGSSHVEALSLAAPRLQKRDSSLYLTSVHRPLKIE